MRLSDLLSVVRPGEAWSLSGDSSEGLVWLDETPKPTEAELEAARPQAELNAAVAVVQAQRAARYRAESDPLFFEWQRGEDGVTKADWEAKVAQIKADLPYPTL